MKNYIISTDRIIGLVICGIVATGEAVMIKTANGNIQRAIIEVVL